MARRLGQFRRLHRYLNFVLRDRRLISSSNLFDANWYKSTYRDVAAAGLDPVRHYALKGGLEGRIPSPRFDPTFYLDSNPDVARSGMNPLIHYLRFGVREGRPSRACVRGASAAEFDSQAALVRQSGLFDEDWYCATYPDVRQSGIDPLAHFLDKGGREGRAPGPRFDSASYLRVYPDVAADGVNPLVHYLKIGRHEGRQIRMWDADGRTVSESGLFDADWYSNRYPEVRNSGLEPLEHYLRNGGSQNFAPGPLFDQVDFFERHPDLAALGQNPLLSFIRSDPQERRYAQSLCIEPVVDRWGPCTPVPVLGGTTARPSIAVAVHVFYVDVFEEICGFLRHFPYRFNLLVTTPSDANAQAIRDAVERKGIDATLFVKVCQNRGRNFGPLLVEFAKLIQRHDLLLHLHTKKSPHNGSAADDWRLHLYRSLIGSKYLINGIIHLFEEENLGVLYPSTHSWLPYWAHHWLSNSHLIDTFYNRLSIPYKRPLEYIDFPVGSMFWARTSALKPLLEAGWTYDDFPAESGQRDGTVAHVIERSIVTVAQHEGYEYAEIDYHAGSLRWNWSRKNLDQYSGRDIRDLYQAIDESDIVSFDVFDTLVTRFSLTPDSLLKYVGWLIAKERPELDNFFEIRKSAELKAREEKRFLGDVNLDEIYRQFPAVSTWPEDAIVSAQDKELNSERRSFVIRQVVVDALKYAHSKGKRVIAITDTYFTRAFIQELLDQFGLMNFLDALYVSSERGTRKDRGDLWDDIFLAEGLHSKRLLHVGDNEHSDAQLPGDRKLPLFHVMSPASLLVNAGIRASADRSWSADLLLGPLAARYFNSPLLPQRRFRPLYLPRPEDLGYVVFGPLLCGFFGWLFTHPALRHLKHLYFLSREGYFLHQLFLTLKEYLPGVLPPASYFYASRRATLAAAQGVNFNPAEITFGSGFRGTIKDLLNVRLGLTLPEDFDLEGSSIVLPDDTEYVNSVLEILRPYIMEHGARELGALQQYCREMNLVSSHPAGIIDIGYSGSIQAALQTCLGQPLVGLYLATTKDVFRVKQSGGYAYGCFAEGETYAATCSTVLGHGRIVESFLTAPHGQVLRFENDEVSGSCTPVYKSHGFSQCAFQTLAEIYKGVTNYVSDAVRTFGAEVLLVPPDLEAAQAPLAALVRHEIILPPQVVGALYLEDEFCGNPVLRAGDLAIAPEESVPVAQ